MVVVTAPVLPDLLGDGVVAVWSGQVGAAERVSGAVSDWVSGACQPWRSRARSSGGASYADDPTPRCKCVFTVEAASAGEGRAPPTWSSPVAGIGAAEESACCEACGGSEPSPDCWLCSWSWLAEARAEHARELAEAAEHAASESAAGPLWRRIGSSGWRR